MNEKDAVKALQNRLAEIDDLVESHRLSAEHTKWLTQTLYLLEDIFGRNSKIYFNFASLTWQARGTFMIEGWDQQQQLERKMHQGYLADLETAKGFLQAGIELIKSKGLENVYEGKDTPEESSEIVKIISLIDNKLRKLIRTTPTKERDVQDAIENLFIAGGLDDQYTREKENLVYSTKTYIPDFVFKKIDLVVEVKLCDNSQRVKEMIAEINDDIVAYKTKYANLIFAIYDLGNIRDQDAFKSSLEANDVIVKIIKH